MLGCLAAWTTAVQYDPFFWDTVQLGSKHAHHFYENGLRWTALPEAIDSGHPPVFGYYLALVWTLFGKTLPAGHWAMFPFLAGIALQLVRLGEHCTATAHNARFWPLGLVLLVFSDPVLAAQSALVGPDIPLVFFFLLTVQALLGGRQAWAVVGILGLCAISTRGMMTTAGLFVWQMLAHRRSAGHLLRTSLVFLPGAGFAAWFLWWHHSATGWTGFHADSPWAPAFEPAQGMDFLKNILVLGWRWTDLGRLVEWGVLGYLVFEFAAAARRRGDFLGGRVSSGSIVQPKWTVLALLLGSLVFFLTPSALLYHNLSAHRYFLPGFLALHLLVFYLLYAADIPGQRKKLLFLVLLIGLGTGNCWIYPRGISMDWDATLAHRPYHRLRADMLRFIEQEKIPLRGIGTAFPNVNTGEHLLLDGDARMFAEKDYQQNQYILASNVFNDFSEADYGVLHLEWALVRRLERHGVWMELYQKKGAP
ncbi:MAG: hypothetical protein IPM98_02475 [Lewinellaceae bacterium]|nr:hypothetical protein [Lewinellaceae bacterium]